jgi:hypothetical protein
MRGGTSTVAGLCPLDCGEGPYAVSAPKYRPKRKRPEGAMTRNPLRDGLELTGINQLWRRLPPTAGQLPDLGVQALRGLPKGASLHLG